jgi:hypothetical protein
MADIVGNTNLNKDQKIVLKSKISNKAKLKFAQFKYVPEKTIFVIVTDVKKNVISQSIDLETGKEILYLKTKKNSKYTYIEVIGSKSSIDNIFSVLGGTASSDTLTKIRENISMWLFQSCVEHNTILSEKQIILKLGIYKIYYDSSYYESSLKQLESLKPIIKSNGYTYERQSGARTKKLYEKARKLSGKTNDNWNPADVWMIKKTFDIDKISAVNDLTVLNNEIALAYANQELFPISLKNISKDKAELSYVDRPTTLLKVKTYDFNFKRVSLSESFNNVIIETASGFEVRCGYKETNTLDITLEGRFSANNYQIGSLDSNTYPIHCKENYNYTVRNGKTKVDQIKSDKEFKEIVRKYPSFSNTIKTYDDAIKILNKSDEFDKQRFSNLISYMYSYLIAPKTTNEFMDNMRYSYCSARKANVGSCMYILID